MQALDIPTNDELTEQDLDERTNREIELWAVDAGDNRTEEEYGEFRNPNAKNRKNNQRR